MPETALDTAYVDLLLGWDTLEKSLGADPVVDFNLLAATGGTSFSSRWDVLRALVALRKQAEREANPLAYRRLSAHEAFLRNRMGEHWDFEPYIAATQGFRFKLYEDAYLEKQQAILADQLAQLDVPLDEKTDKAFEAKDTELSQNEVIAFHTDFLQRCRPALEKIIGESADFNLTIEFEHVDAYWSAWVDGMGRDFRLRFNTYHDPQFFVTRMTQLALHELMAHLVQASLLLRRIERQELPRWLGLTVVHGPEMFQQEGLAQALQWFWALPEARTPMVLARSQMSRLSGLALHNAHIRLEAGVPLELVVDEVLRWAPWREAGKVAHGLNSAGNHPLYRSYEFVYGASCDFFANLAEGLTLDQRHEVLRQVYTQWMTYDDLVGLRHKGLRHKVCGSKL